MAQSDYSPDPKSKKALSTPGATLEPNRDQLEIFIWGMFCHCDGEGIVSLRAFFENEERPPFRILNITLQKGVPVVVELAEKEARLAANNEEAVVFCPPVATFRRADGRVQHAREQDLLEAPALSVELDENPRAALAKLEQFLGPATFVVRSGGIWTNPATGENEDKLHAHWRLTTPARGETIPKLKQARRIATALVGADASNVPACHPIRWPGSWHRKAEPRLCEIIESSDHEIDLEIALNTLTAVAPASISIQMPSMDYAANGGGEQVFLPMVARTVSYISNPDLPWYDYNNIGMAIYVSTGGSNEGYEIFDKFARKAKGQRHGKDIYNENRTKARWRSYHNSPPTRTGFNKLYNLAMRDDPEGMDEFDQEQIEIRTRADMYDAFEVKGELPIKEKAPEVEVEVESEPEPEPSRPTGPSGPTGMPPPPETSAFYWDGEANQDLAIRWTVKNLIPEIGVGLISGQWGTGKTFIAIYLAACIMTGRAFIDYRIKRQGGVLFIALEGRSSIRLRLAVMKEHSLELRDGEQLPFIWPKVNIEATLLSGRATELLINQVKQAKKEMKSRFGIDLVLVIIDTMQLAGGYQREGEGTEGTFVMKELRKVAEATRTFILGVDHFGKDAEKGTRGAMTKEDNCDTVLALTGERALTGRVSNAKMGLRKVKEGECGREIPFRLETVNCGVDEDGDAVTSKVVRWDTDRPPTADPAQRPSQTRTVFEYAMRETIRENGDHGRFPGWVAVRDVDVRTKFVNAWGAARENDPEDQARRYDNARKRWSEARREALKAGWVERKGDYFRVSEADFLANPRAEEEALI
jgi:hypothetical protein